MKTYKPKRDLLSLDDLSAQEILTLCERAAFMKQALKNGDIFHPLPGKTLGMIFEKSSTRTRVSFEVGMFQLGGKAIFLSVKDIQMGRGEPVSDSARVLSRYLDALLIRTFEQERVVEMARWANIPVINGLTDKFHPCQVLTDIFTYQERRGPLAGRRVAWIGDGNNMAHSWILAAGRLGFTLVLACPEGFDPHDDVFSRVVAEGGDVHSVRDPRDAARHADLVVTDVWTSMGQEAENERRLKAFAGYQVNVPLMKLAAPDALFMHCLPAHRGEEVTEEVLDGPWSVVWDEAENRLHVQKAILELLIRDEH